MQGQVVYAWEKCELDPTCCCAELSMEDASVQVSRVPVSIVYLRVRASEPAVPLCPALSRPCHSTPTLSLRVAACFCNKCQRRSLIACIRQVLFRATSDGGDVGAGSDGTKIAEVAEYSGPDFKAYFSPDELAVLTPTPQVTRST